MPLAGTQPACPLPWLKVDKGPGGLAGLSPLYGLCCFGVRVDDVSPAQALAQWRVS